jgi:hypothetical protein
MEEREGMEGREGWREGRNKGKEVQNVVFGNTKTESCFKMTLWEVSDLKTTNAGLVLSYSFSSLLLVFRNFLSEPPS